MLVNNCGPPETRPWALPYPPTPAPGPDLNGYSNRRMPDIQCLQEPDRADELRRGDLRNFHHSLTWLTQLLP